MLNAYDPGGDLSNIDGPSNDPLLFPLSILLLIVFTLFALVSHTLCSSR